MLKRPNLSKYSTVGEVRSIGLSLKINITNSNAGPLTFAKSWICLRDPTIDWDFDLDLERERSEDSAFFLLFFALDITKKSMMETKQLSSIYSKSAFKTVTPWQTAARRQGFVGDRSDHWLPVLRITTLWTYPPSPLFLEGRRVTYLRLEQRASRRNEVGGGRRLPSLRV